jgi:nitroreductase
MGITGTDEKGNIICVEENSDICIYCCHCVTVCPTQAIKLNAIEDKEKLEWIHEYGVVPFSLSPAECIPSMRHNLPKVEKIEALIKSRRMTRTFTDELVDKNTIGHIFGDVLKYAPSGHNTRGFNARIVEGREKIEKLTSLTCDCLKQMMKDGGLHKFDRKVFEKIIYAWENEGIDRVMRSAKQLVVIDCKTSIVPANPAVLVLLTYFEMLANTMGIGTVWAGYFMVAASFYKPIKEFLDVPDDNTIYGAMMFGHKGCEYDLIPKRPDINIIYK